MFSMSSILTTFKFKSSENKNSKSAELEGSANGVKKTSDISTFNKENPSQGEKKPSPCCCCKETKQKRDACIVENGAENCTELIEAHRICMKGYGYDV